MQRLLVITTILAPAAAAFAQDAAGPASAPLPSTDAGVPVELSNTKAAQADSPPSQVVADVLPVQAPSLPPQRPATEQNPSEQPIQELQEIVVTSARIGVPVNENPSAASVVTEEQLETMPRSIGAEEALRLVPGVKVDNQADGERVHLSIRGQGLLTERGIRGIKVLLDGVPLNDPSGFAPDLFDVDWANVERIEVMRGPASALYGSGSAGGIISVTTKGGGHDLIGGEALATTGSHNFWKEQAGAGGSTEKLNYHLSASRTYGDGYRVHTQFDAVNLYGKLQWHPLPELRLRAILAGTTFFNQNAEGLNQQQMQQDPRQPNPDALTYNEYQRTRRLTLGLVGQYQIGEFQDVDVSLYQRGTAWKESVPSSLQDRSYYSPGGALQYNLHLGRGWLRDHLSAGADLDFQWIKDRRHPNLGGGIAGPDLQSDQTIGQRGLGFFVLDRIEVGRTLSVFVGVRHDRIHNQLTDHLRAGGVDLSGTADFSKTTARAGASWNPRPAIGLYANWSQGFLPPATEELGNNPDALGGFNTHLVPATSMSEEIGARGLLKGQFSYDLALFHLATDNDFGRYRITSRPLETFYQNAGASRRYGVETALGWYPMDALSVNVAYTYSNFKYTSIRSLFGDYTDTFMPNSPQHQASAYAQYIVAKHWVLGVGGDAVSSWYVDQSNTLKADGYALLHLRLAFRWSTTAYRGEVFAYGRNVLGSKYIGFTEPDPDGNSFQPAPKAEVFVGARLGFGK